MKKQEKLIETLKKITGVSFVSVTYTNQNNETSQQTFNVGVDMKKAKEKDMKWLETLNVNDLEVDIDKDKLEEARISLLQNLKTPNQNRVQGIQNAFTRIGPGLEIRNETNSLYVFGLKVKKTTITEGDYKEDTRNELRKAKDYLRTLMKSTQYRRFEVGKAFKYKVLGDVIEFKNV
jgi:NADH dehydrogenase/NADH:ubiquinone oxidoreductase subunit G